MIGISSLYCGRREASDELRYATPARLPSGAPAVVVYNCTRRCNLRCVHCYSASVDAPGTDELSTAEAMEMIDDLAGSGVKVLLLSGGEPTMRDDLIGLVERAAARSLRVALSSNGVAITPRMAQRLAAAGLTYAGISLDGVGAANDRFRGQSGAYERALAGLASCRDAGIRVGLRFTMTTSNVSQIPAIFELLASENIPRVCFYHLVPAGRGTQLSGQALDHARTRDVLDTLMDLSAQAQRAGRTLQVLTVDNHADGPYVYLRLLREGRGEAAGRCLELLRRNGGNASGQRIGCVSWNGDVLPDQFWRDAVLGNVRQRPFSEIWSDPDQPLLARLRDRKRYLTGRRCSRCRWLDVCNANLRARAAAAGDAWGDDPACYLTDREIAS